MGCVMALPGQPDSGGDISSRLHAQGLIGGNAAQNKDAPPEDIFDFITKIIEKTGDWITKATGFNVGSAFNTGALANAKIEQAGIQVNNQMIRQGFVVPGGVLAAGASMIINKNNFGNITAPAIEGLPVSEMNMASASFGDLGGLIPGPAGLPDMSSGRGSGVVMDA